MLATAIHAGHELRPEASALTALSDDQRLREEDPFTDRWVEIAANSIVVSPSRFEVDLNRPRDKAVYREPADAWGLELWKSPPSDEFVDDSLAVYDQFYAELGELCDRLVETPRHVRRSGSAFVQPPAARTRPARRRPRRQPGYQPRNRHGRARTEAHRRRVRQGCGISPIRSWAPRRARERQVQGWPNDSMDQRSIRQSWLLDRRRDEEDLHGRMERTTRRVDHHRHRCGARQRGRAGTQRAPRIAPALAPRSVRRSPSR